MTAGKLGQWQFGRYVADLDARRLVKDGEPVPLGTRAFDVLAALVRRSGEALSKSELMEAAWPGLVVEENNLSVQVAALRKLLGREVVVTVAGVGYQLGMAARPVLAEQGGAGVAVLAFKALEPAASAIAAAIAEDLVTALGRFRSLRVASASSSLGLGCGGSRTTAIARQLGVRYLVEGSLRSAGHEARLAVRLLDAATDRQIWGESFDCAGVSLLHAQDELAAGVAAALQPQIEFAERRAAAERVDPSSPYAIALRAWDTLRNHDAFEPAERRDRARTLAKEALAKDPLCSLAARTIAWAQYSELFLAPSRSAEAGAREAVRLLSRVIAADPLDHQSFHFRGLLEFLLGENRTAIDDLRRASELNPNDATTIAYLGYMLAVCGEPVEGVALATRSLELSPRDPQRYLLHVQLAGARFVSGDYAGALHQARKSATDAPWFPAAWLWIAISSMALDDAAQAADAVSELRRLAPQYLESRMSGNWLGSDRAFHQRATMLLRQAATG